MFCEKKFFGGGGRTPRTPPSKSASAFRMSGTLPWSNIVFTICSSMVIICSPALMICSMVMLSISADFPILMDLILFSNSDNVATGIALFLTSWFISWISCSIFLWYPKISKLFFLSMCDVKVSLTFTSLSLVLLWQLFYLFCSSIVIHTVIVTAVMKAGDLAL